MFKGIAIALGFTLGAGAALADQPGQARIRSLSYAGSGCPSGSVSASLSSDGALVLDFDDFLLSVGRGSSISERRKNCQLHVDLVAPAGYSYAISGMSALVYADLGAHSAAQMTARGYYHGASEQRQLQSKVVGPLNDDVRLADQLRDRDLLWSSCGAQRALNLNLEQRATGDSVRLEGGEHFGLQWVFLLKWRRCPS